MEDNFYGRESDITLHIPYVGMVFEASLSQARSARNHKSTLPPVQGLKRWNCRGHSPALLESFQGLVHT